MSHRFTVLGNSFPLYGSPTADAPYRGGLFPRGLEIEVGVIIVFTIVVAVIAFIVLGLVLLAEVWWYGRHPTTQVGVMKPRVSLVPRFAVYWAIAVALGAIVGTLLTIALPMLGRIF